VDKKDNVDRGAWIQVPVHKKDGTAAISAAPRVAELKRDGLRAIFRRMEHERVYLTEIGCHTRFATLRIRADKLPVS
jgi:hypothetical protein